jgi:hypothetical protein
MNDIQSSKQNEANSKAIVMLKSRFLTSNTFDQMEMMIAS